MIYKSDMEWFIAIRRTEIHHWFLTYIVNNRLLIKQYQLSCNPQSILNNISVD